MKTQRQQPLAYYDATKAEAQQSQRADRLRHGYQLHRDDDMVAIALRMLAHGFASGLSVILGQMVPHPILILSLSLGWLGYGAAMYFKNPRQFDRAAIYVPIAFGIMAGGWR